MYDSDKIVTRPISVEQHDQNIDRRISELQVQLERLNAVIDQPGRTPQSLEAVEHRIWSLTQQFAEILDKWTLSDLRHTRAIGEMEARLRDLEGLKVRIEHNAEDQLRDLQKKVASEWTALQQMLEQPIKQLQEHAATLRETSVATAGSALSGLERAETTLATIQADLSERMEQLSREVQSTLAEIRGGPPRAGQSAGNANWPLAQVMRLHNELRESDDHHAMAEESTPAEAVTTGRRRRPGWIAAVAVLGATLFIAVFYLLRLQEQNQAAAIKIDQVEQQAQSTRAAAEKQIAASQQEAERRISEARDAAVKAQMVSEVLAAPDLVRYSLSGGDAAPDARGQLLWSRSRGIVLSASRIPKPPSGVSYELWLLTPAGATHAGSPDADAEGRLSFTTGKVDAVPRPIIGVALTTESSKTGDAPSGPTVLIYRRAEIPGTGGETTSNLR